MSFDVIDEYNDSSTNTFKLEPSILAGNPAEKTDTATGHLPEMEVYDPVAMADDFGNFLDKQLKDEANKEADKPKLKDKYDTTQIDAATDAAIKNDKLMFVHVGSPSCGPCLKMEKEVWPGVEKANKGQYAFVHMNGDLVDEKKGTPEAMKNGEKLLDGVNGYPTLRVVKPTLEKDGSYSYKVLSERTGFQDAKGLGEMMQEAQEALKPKVKR